MEMSGKKQAEMLLDQLRNDPLAWKEYQRLIAEPYVLGFMVWGSRATGFGAPDCDWDALVYTTEEYYRKLELKDTLWLDFDESVEPKRLVTDLSPVSDAWFRQQLESSLDIDHSPYAEGVTIYDKTGRLEEWRQKLARYPEEEHEDRLKNKFILLVDAHYTAIMDDKRSFLPDRQVNLYRAILAAIHLWFSLQKAWSPPLKWWSRHVKKLGMDEETFHLFTKSFDSPTVENVGKLVNYLRQMIVDQGYDFPNDFLSTFLETIHTSGRLKQIRHVYL